MADNLTTPIPDATKLGTKDLSGVHIPKNIIVDQSGNDPIGQAVESPGAFTLLGLLKAIKTALAGTLTVGLPTGAATAAKQDAVKESIDAAALVAVPFPIAPHVTTPLPRTIKALGIVTGGTVVFRAPGGTEDVTLDLGPGLWPLPATHIRATSTATGLTGF